MYSKLAHKIGPPGSLERECENLATPNFVQTLKMTWKTFLNTCYKGNFKKFIKAQNWNITFFPPLKNSLLRVGKKDILFEVHLSLPKLHPQ